MSTDGRGGIYRLVAPKNGIPAALVLVTGMEHDWQGDIAFVTLLSPDVEFGSSTDILATKHEIGRPYDLLIETDIFSYAWRTQLDRLIVPVEDAILRAVADMRDSNEITMSIGGPPILHRSDPRWTFKLQELDRLQALTSDCVTSLIDAGPNGRDTEDGG